MQKIGLNELRTKFKQFYESKEHLAHKSFPLVPRNDKSLLLINSGMAPLKPYFAGLDVPPAKRMTTCQKCIRTGDLENVGYTARHGTFFEMLGSFSFGDYFKKESLLWGWEFMVDVLGLPVEKLWVSIYEDDDEAYEIWVNDVGVDPAKIVRMGKEDNFWEIGLGPCGPCSEVYFDRGEKYGCGEENCKPGCECDRYIEFWNHVFTQFNRDEAGNYTPLANPNIDTGMGLERIACIMQDTDSIFDVDTVRTILDEVCKLADVEYKGGEDVTDISIRIITDHIRSVTFMISDGIIPSNEGRGYVLRRLLRRASVHGRKLGINQLFLADLSNKVIETSGEEYEELVEKKANIQKIISVEEERFAVTINQGSEMINEYITAMKERKESVLAGDVVFNLYDTHGFNPELTREILAEHNFDIDEEGYRSELKRQQENSRSGIKVTADEAWAENDQIFSDLPKTEFVGYDEHEKSCKVVTIISDSHIIDEAGEGSSVIMILDKTPFYAESGGQAGDKGEIFTENATIKVLDVRKVRDVFVHYVEILEGTIKTNDAVNCKIDSIDRNKTARNHTATHLLHKALAMVLGEHIQQAGSSVDPDQLRFDFTHYEALDTKQISQIENIVNTEIEKFLPVHISNVSLMEAKDKGAVALFDEKYGDTVRVVEIGEFSMELCGGTHVRNSGEIGAFKITSESSVSSGTRRIEAITGTNILRPLLRAENIMTGLSKVLKANPGIIMDRVSNLIDEIKAMRVELDEVKKEKMTSSVDDLIASATEINGGNLITAKFEGLSVDELRALCDTIRDKTTDVVIGLASVVDEKVLFIVSVSDAMQEKGYHAGNLIKTMAKAAGGGGGGKADMAQAGAKDPSKVDDAFEAALAALNE